MDFPPDTYLHFLREPALDLSAVKHLLITHSHADHFYPEDIVLRCPCFSTTLTGKLHVYGNAKMADRCRALIAASPPSFGAGDFLEIHTLEPFVTVELGGYRVTPVLADHAAGEDSFLYVIQREGKTLLYGNDTGIQLCQETWEALAGFCFDLLSLDCTACDRSVARNHMGVPNNQALVERLTLLGAVNHQTQVVITHFTHHKALTQQQLEALVQPMGWRVAYDGFQITL